MNCNHNNKHNMGHTDTHDDGNTSNNCHGHDYLKQSTIPVDVMDKSISQLTDDMLMTGFQGRKLAEAIECWLGMLKDDDLTIFMGLSGAMVPAGMRRIISYLIEHRLIDCLVSTGANIFHDCHEALGQKHYVGSHTANDCALFSKGVDRIYDVFAVEDEFHDIEIFIGEFAKTMDDSRTYSSREFLYQLGKHISEKGGADDSIIVSAFKNNVPIFIPALCDSSIGIGLTLARREGCKLVIDQIKDVDEITQIVEVSGKTGVVYFGGGVPKNFIQQTQIVAGFLGAEVTGHDRAIQFTTDAPHWGGLSGCTFEEAISWGKIGETAKKVQVFVDSTIAFPIVSHSLHEKTKGLVRSVPAFDWSGNRARISHGPVHINK